MRIVVGFTPGGVTDVAARIIAQKLTEAWGQTVVVENRAGASGIIGAETVAKAAPDGYTLLIAPQTSTSVATTLYPKLPYDVLRDIPAITVLGSSPQLLVVHPSLPPRTFKEFVAFAKANYKTLSFGSGGLGSTPHLEGELLNLSLNIKMVHIPYKGENTAAADVLGGQLPLMFSSLPVSLPLSKSGKLRALAITSLQRSPLAPEYPTIAESGIPDFEGATWVALHAPGGISKELLARINADVIKVLNLPDTRERLAQQGIDRVGNSPDEAAAYVKSEIVKWARVIKAANVRIDQ
ncbi:MAG TPA: tripartite tricarboxylate transporter substrate binding protein [Burkholderiales bacterium]|nr:tripartite tricarboxylate transporter substrate binding protein [Burkholderiales bacterium]